MPIFSRGEVKTPDFAFPQTVSKEAEEDLDAAIKAKDAHAVLNALIRQSIASSLVDPSMLQLSIERVERAERKFIGNPLYGLFEALLAQMYLAAYEGNMYIYNSRTLPISLNQTDITEWSGPQYQSAIRSLCKESYANADALSELKTADYADIIAADKLTLLYFPTLLDFVYANATSIMNAIDDKSDAYAAPLSSPLISEGARIYWATQQALMKGNKSNGSNETQEDALKNLYQEYKDSQLAGYILGIFGNRVRFSNEEGIAQAAWAVQEIKDFQSRFPNNPNSDWLANVTQTLTQPDLEITVPKYCQPGHDIAMEVSNRSANMGNVKVYFWCDSLANNRQEFSKIRSQLKNPVATFPIENNQEAPFLEKQILTFKPDKPGTYIILPEMENGEYSSYYPSLTYCVPAYPVIFSNSPRSYVAAVEPVTGRPVAGAKVYLRQDKGSVYAGSTNKDGFVDVSNMLKTNSDNRCDVILKIDNKNYDFSQYIRAKTPSQATKNYNASINTDRSIYHPGDSIHVLAVVYQIDTDTKGRTSSKIVPDYDIRVTLYDENNQKVTRHEGKTDAFGRLAVDFVAPVAGLTGEFRIKVSGDSLNSNQYVTVSDYKMPDFEIKDVTTARLPEDLNTVRVKGQALSYSGFPMADAEIELNVVKATWWRWFSPSSEVLFSSNATTDPQGCFQIDVPVDKIQEEDDRWAYFIAKIDATSSAGSSAKASVPFSLGKQYKIEISDNQTYVDGQKPYSPTIQAYDINGNEAKIAMTWKLIQDEDTIQQGEVGTPIDLANAKPGTYTLQVESVDTTLADVASMQFTVYNTSTDIVPGNDPLWVLKSSYTIPAQGKATIDVLMGCPDPDTYYYMALADYSELFGFTPRTDSKGYHHLTVDIPAEFANGNVYLVGVKKCQSFQETLTLTRALDTKLKIEGSAMRDRLAPSTEETWNLRVLNPDGKPVEAAMMLDMYNKALEAIIPHSVNIRSAYGASYATISINSPYNYNFGVSTTGKLKPIAYNSLSEPAFYFYGYSLVPNRYMLYECCDVAMPMSSRGMLRSAKMMSAVEENSLEAVAVDEEASAEVTSDSQGEASKPNEEFDYREADVPLAVWAPRLTTNADGNLAFTFKVPNANTTWRLQALAWTKEMYVGSMIREFVANKPIMVQPNVPRFLRAGDRALIKATVMNNSDEAVTATSSIEFFNPVTNEVIATYDFSNDIDSMASADIQAWVEAAIDASSIGYRVKASNGTFSDGEQGVMPILSADASLIETTPFYLNPGDTSWEMRLPASKDARLSLTFSENPAWTIVSALPGLRNSIGSTANSAAAALYAARISQGLMDANPNIARALQEWLDNPNDSTLISSLEKNEDLKIALLNCTPWVQAAQSDTERMANLALIFNKKECKSTIDAAIKQLSKLQRADGGWSWATWIDESSPWVTGNVLGMLGDLSKLGWLPSDKKLKEMIEKAVKYWDQSFAKNWDEKAKRTDLLYTLIRPYFPEISVGTYGQKVIANTTQAILKKWKDYSDPAYKAMAAEALYLNSYEKMSHELMKSISEFGVWTKDQGLKFPSVNALYDYAILLEAYAMIEPENKAVDGLRQQLIVRKQATDWGSSVVTMEVVKAILSSGTSWTVPAQGATIMCGTSMIQPSTPIEKYTGSLRADLSPYAGEELMIATSGVGPAYGAVYAQFKQAMEDVKSSSCEDLSIEKRLAVRRGADWEYADSFKVGDRVKVVLTIKCKRNLSYVTIIDERAAALQPVDQVPGWLWSEGVGFYRENRDSFTGLYVDYMTPGTYQLTYELNVNTAGSFSSGVASIQSQYAPELSAHSAGSHIIVNN